MLGIDGKSIQHKLYRLEMYTKFLSGKTKRKRILASIRHG
jgi:hypothetical protein